MEFISAFKLVFSKREVSIKFSFTFVKDIPQEMKRNVVYLVGERSYLWAAAFFCPCGCGELITLNLLKEARPRWKFHIRWGRISLFPSIWRKVGCGSHFHVRKGKIKWSYL